MKCWVEGCRQPASYNDRKRLFRYSVRSAEGEIVGHLCYMHGRRKARGDPHWQDPERRGSKRVEDLRQIAKRRAMDWAFDEGGTWDDVEKACRAIERRLAEDRRREREGKA